MSKTPEIKRLVVNGCSYMDFYAQGNGHKELADKLIYPLRKVLRGLAVVINALLEPHLMIVITMKKLYISLD